MTMLGVVRVLHGFVGGVRSEKYGHDGPGVCLGDGQMENEGIPLEGGRGDALLRRMPPDLTSKAKLKLLL